MEETSLAQPAFTILAFAAAVGSGITGGIFYGFSSFIMQALGRLPPDQGVAAMKAINVTVINPVFMLAFMGTALVSLALSVLCVLALGETASQLALAGSLSYLLGCIGVTMALNVPLNNALAAVEPAGEAALWARYRTDWTLWNTVRTAACVASMGLFIAAPMN